MQIKDWEHSPAREGFGDMVWSPWRGCKESGWTLKGLGRVSVNKWVKFCHFSEPTNIFLLRLGVLGEPRAAHGSFPPRWWNKQVRQTEAGKNCGAGVAIGVYARVLSHSFKDAGGECGHKLMPNGLTAYLILLFAVPISWNVILLKAKASDWSWFGQTCPHKIKGHILSIIVCLLWTGLHKFPPSWRESIKEQCWGLWGTF